MKSFIQEKQNNSYNTVNYKDPSYHADMSTRYFLMYLRNPDSFTWRMHRQHCLDYYYYLNNPNGRSITH